MIVVVDYGMGNLHSVSKALETVGADVKISGSSEDLKDASAIVLPGVGAFGEGMQQLKDRGLISALNQEVRINKKPFLGICLGMQLTATLGQEYGPCEGLGWFDAQVVRFPVMSREYKIPHMGWNDVELTTTSPLFNRLKSPTAFYFVHSFHFEPKDQSVVVARCSHGIEFVAAVSRENIHLVQFHPEKSQDKGLQVLENFVDLARAVC